MEYVLLNESSQIIVILNGAKRSEESMTKTGWDLQKDIFHIICEMASFTNKTSISMKNWFITDLSSACFFDNCCSNETGHE